MIPRLVCLDLDGTCVTYDRDPAVLHPDVIRLLNRLPEFGAKWAVNSGRGWDGQVEILEVSREAGLTNDPCVLISREAFIHFLDGEGKLQEHRSWNETSKELMLAVHAAFQAVLAPRLVGFMEKYTPLEAHIHPDGTSFLIPSDPEPGLPQACYEELLALSGQADGSTVIRNGGWVAVLPESLGKGVVLREVMRKLSLSPEEVLAVGDHLNDRCMLDGSSAGLVGCPGNAFPEIQQVVRAAGGKVSDRPAGEGTAEILKAFFSS